MGALRQWHLLPLLCCLAVVIGVVVATVIAVVSSNRKAR
jgi:hypothetical protein